MIVRPAPKGPAELAVLLTNGQIVDGRVAHHHQTMFMELPVNGGLDSIAFISCSPMKIGTIP